MIIIIIIIIIIGEGDDMTTILCQVKRAPFQSDGILFAISQMRNYKGRSTA